MQIKRLTITNVRVFERAEFDFQSGMNLLVGINGAGKSTVLDVLRIMLSKQIHNFTVGRGNRLHFDESYISIGQESFETELNFHLADIPFRHRMTLERNASDTDGDLAPNNHAIRQEVKEHDENPLAIYFSTGRFMPTLKKPKQSVSRNNQSTAYIDALKPRPLQLREFAQWWLVQDALRHERPLNEHLLKVLNTAIDTFLRGYSNLRAEKASEILLIDKNGITLDVRQLSDGERSVLAVVLDIAKRLALANPGLDEPLRDGKAVILIDEIGIHLHPSWERKIVERLTTTFPGCQFIATTHSPQIIGEVPPEQIFLIKNTGIERPDQSLGMDSGWILRHLMDVSELNETISKRLDEIENLIEKSQLQQAKAVIRELKPRISDSPELARLQTRIDLLEMLSGNEG